MSDFVGFGDVTSEHYTFVGAKAYRLGQLYQKGFPVPKGLVITSKPFYTYLSVCDSHVMSHSSLQGFHADLLKQIDLLGFERLAVRSSATVEDGTNFSWSGIFSSFLGVSRSNILHSVVNCWCSIRTEIAESHAKVAKTSMDRIGMAVILQEFVNADVSGIMFTKSKRENSIVIEAVWGLGDYLAQGKITPDMYIIDRVSREIKTTQVTSQTSHRHFCKDANGVVEQSNSKTDLQKLSHTQIQTLVEYGMEIEKFFGVPQDIEFCINSDGIRILQSRPIL